MNIYHVLGLAIPDLEVTRKLVECKIEVLGSRQVLHLIMKGIISIGKSGGRQGQEAYHFIQHISVRGRWVCGRESVLHSGGNRNIFSKNSNLQWEIISSFHSTHHRLWPHIRPVSLRARTSPLTLWPPPNREEESSAGTILPILME